MQTLVSQLSSTLMQLLFSSDWGMHESWENSHANSHESWENSHANSHFSTRINSHATLVLVWPGHESWENSHATSTLASQLSSSCDQRISHKYIAMNSGTRFSSDDLKISIRIVILRDTC
jgi:hypothetical protein